MGRSYFAFLRLLLLLRCVLRLAWSSCVSCHEHSSSPSQLYSGAESLACRAAEGKLPHTCEASSRAKRERLVVFVVCGMICVVRFALCVLRILHVLFGLAVRNDF